MSRGTKFSESQLLKLGFHQDASGEWSKDGVSPDNSKSPLALDQSDERTKPLAKEEGEGGGEASLRYRLVVTSYRTHLIDPSNASMKQIEDCLSVPKGRKDYGVGVFPDDSPEFCDQPLFIQWKVPKGLERTEIQVLAY